MSMMIIATSLSAVGAAALTAGGFALRQRWASRVKATSDADRSPIQAFAGEHAALSSLSATAPGLSDSHVLTANTLRFDDPYAAVAAVSAVQRSLTGATALESRPLNAAGLTLGEVRNDA